jgi:hypothetical protein
MTQTTTRNVFLGIGVWTCARVIAFLVRVLLIPINNRLIFSGNAGTVAWWLWEGFLNALVAAFAAVALVWVVETKKPLNGVGAPAALFLYGGGAYCLAANCTWMENTSAFSRLHCNFSAGHHSGVGVPHRWL